MIDRMLRETHKLKNLSLSLPTCDLEYCRIQGLSYDYHFPELNSLSLAVYDSPDSGLPDFLARHSSITVLNLQVQGDKPLRFSDSAFPNLRALRADWIWGKAFSDLLSTSGSRTITYLNVGSELKGSYADIVKVSRTLTCLEVSNPWRKKEFPEPLKSLLSKLPEIQEIGFDMGNTSWMNDDGSWGGPEPMDVKNLVLTPSLPQSISHH
jgi:hypothetical protein